MGCLEGPPGSTPPPPPGTPVNIASSSWGVLAVLVANDPGAGSAKVSEQGPGLRPSAQHGQSGPLPSL